MLGLQLQTLAGFQEFLQYPLMLLKLELCISNHTTMMLNLTQDLTMFLDFVSQFLIDGRFLPLWFQRRTILCIVINGQRSFQEVSQQVDTHA